MLLRDEVVEHQLLSDEVVPLACHLQQLKMLLGHGPLSLQGQLPDVDGLYIVLCVQSTSVDRQSERNTYDTNTHKRTHIVERGALGRFDVHVHVGLGRPLEDLGLVRGLLHRHGLLLPRGAPPARAGALALLLDAAVRQVLKELEGLLALLVGVLEAPGRGPGQLVVNEPAVERGVPQALLCALFESRDQINLSKSCSLSFVESKSIS